MKIRDRKAFLDNHPELRRWIRECARCHRKGFDIAFQLQMYPEEVQVRFKRFFKPLEVGADGLCERCNLIVHRLDQHQDVADVGGEGGDETDDIG